MIERLEKRRLREAFTKRRGKETPYGEEKESEEGKKKTERDKGYPPLSARRREEEKRDGRTGRGCATEG